MCRNDSAPAGPSTCQLKMKGESPALHPLLLELIPYVRIKSEMVTLLAFITRTSSQETLFTILSPPVTTKHLLKVLKKIKYM